MRLNSRISQVQTLQKRFGGTFVLCGFLYIGLLLNPNALVSQNLEKPFTPFVYKSTLVVQTVRSLPPLSLIPIAGPVHQDSASQAGPASVSPGSPPLSKFGNQLLWNFKHLFSSHNLKPFIIGSAATGVSFPFDNDIKDYFWETHRANALGEIGAIIGNPLVLGVSAGGALLWSYSSSNDRFRSMSFSLTQALIMDYTMTAALKLVVPRERPDASGKFSFPSGHSSGIFAAATVISHYYKKAAIPAFATASLVAFSRIEKNKHYLSDVVFGAMLGIITARTAVRGTNTFWGEKITWMPCALPGGGVAVFVTWKPDW